MHTLARPLLAAAFLAMVIVARAADPGSAFLTLALEKALPDGTPLVVDLATADGKVITGYVGTRKVDVRGLALHAPKLLGEITTAQPPACALTIDAAIEAGALSGTYRGTVDGKDVAGVLAGTCRTKDALLGSRDFYPSDNRPVGWRGDGTGAWPSATPVAYWDADQGRNVVWHVDTPGAGLCQPVVAGDRVFITADPNLLCCYSVHDGTLLWKTTIDHTLCMKDDDRTAARAEQAFFDDQWKAYAIWRCKLRKVELAVAKSLAGKRITGDLLFASGKIPTLPLQSTPAHSDGLHAPAPERHEQVLTLLEGNTAARDLYLAVQEEAMANGWIMQRSDNSRMVIPAAWPFLERYKQAQEQWNLWCSLGNNWLGYTSYSFATPVTDGTYVYVTTANNVVAAVDYRGKVAWMIWECRRGRGAFGAQTAGVMHTQYVPSPTLLDGKLVVNQMGLLRAYDAATGKKLWEVWGPSAVADGKIPDRYYYRGDPEASSPTAGYLPLPDGGRLAVVTDSGGHLWRLDDGKLLARGVPEGRTVILHRESGIVVGSGTVARLQAKGREEVTVTPLWSGAFMKFCSQPMVGDHYVSLDTRAAGGKTNRAAAFDVRTGAVSWTSKGDMCAYGDEYCSPIIAGGRLYAFRSSTGRGYKVATSLSEVDNGVLTCAVADLETGAVSVLPSAAIDKRCLGDDEFAVLNKTVGWGYQQNASPSAQGNRLFYRSRGTLWCIGDPKQPYDWNPASGPQE